MSALPVLVCGLVCLGGAPAWSLSDVVPAETVGQRTTGIYSDMAMNDESGDVVGIEIFVVYSRAGYYVINRYDDILHVLQDWQTFSSADGIIGAVRAPEQVAMPMPTAPAVIAICRPKPAR